MARVAYLSRATAADATHTFCVATDKDGSEWNESNMEEAKRSLRCRVATSTGDDGDGDGDGDGYDVDEVLLEKCLRQRKGDVEQAAKVLLNVSRARVGSVSGSSIVTKAIAAAAALHGHRRRRRCHQATTDTDAITTAYTYHLPHYRYNHRQLIAFRRDVGWSLTLKKASVHALALHSGMHHLHRDQHGRAVIVFNCELLNRALCPIERFQHMGMYLMEQVRAM